MFSTTVDFKRVVISSADAQKLLNDWNDYHKSLQQYAASLNSQRVPRSKEATVKKILKFPFVYGTSKHSHIFKEV